MCLLCFELFGFIWLLDSARIKSLCRRAEFLVFEATTPFRLLLAVICEPTQHCQAAEKANSREIVAVQKAAEVYFKPKEI